MKLDKEQITIDIKSKLLKGEEIETFTKKLEKDFNSRSIEKMIKTAEKEIIAENIDKSLQLFNEQKSLKEVENNLKTNLPNSIIEKVIVQVSKDITKNTRKNVKFELENTRSNFKELRKKYSNEIITEKQINYWIKDYYSIINTREKDAKKQAIMISIGLIVLGIIITGGSYFIASENSSRFIITYGIIIAGGAKLFQSMNMHVTNIPKID